MASERNRIVELKEYLSSLGISVNIGKNKARGHKGIFMHRFDKDRIDISEGIEQENIVPVIMHEFAHYIHYSYDKTLTSLNFIFDNYTDDIREELIKITVNEVPKEYAESLFVNKKKLNSELKDLVSELKLLCPDFKMSEKNKKIERAISYPIKYLLKYDRVKYMGNLYSLFDMEKYGLSDEVKLYLKIKSKQRAIKRINTRISKLNRYYNQPSELFARFISSYYTAPEYTCQTAPIASSCVKKSRIPHIEKLNRIFM